MRNVLCNNQNIINKDFENFKFYSRHTYNKNYGETLYDTLNVDQIWDLDFIYSTIQNLNKTKELQIKTSSSDCFIIYSTILSHHYNRFFYNIAKKIIQILPKLDIGVHLRYEWDACEYWGVNTNFTYILLNFLKKMPIKTIYISSGIYESTDENDYNILLIKEIKNILKEYKIINKKDILYTTLYLELKTIIDFYLLLNIDFYVYNSESSFGLSICYLRSLFNKPSLVGFIDQRYREYPISNLK
jgi:hypothetical protein